MKALGAKTLELLWQHFPRREEHLRQIVTERLATHPPPILDDCIVATYFFAFRSLKLRQAVEEISYHATVGVKQPALSQALRQCYPGEAR